MPRRQQVECPDFLRMWLLHRGLQRCWPSDLGALLDRRSEIRKEARGEGTGSSGARLDLAPELRWRRRPRRSIFFFHTAKGRAVARSIFSLSLSLARSLALSDRHSFTTMAHLRKLQRELKKPFGIIRAEGSGALGAAVLRNIGTHPVLFRDILVPGTSRRAGPEFRPWPGGPGPRMAMWLRHVGR